MILTLVRCIQLLHADHFSGTVSSRPLPHHLLLLHPRLVLADGAHTVGVYTLAMKDRETGCSRGFGGVEMPDSHAAERAMDALNGTPLSGRTLTVNEARPREPRREPRQPRW